MENYRCFRLPECPNKWALRRGHSAACGGSLHRFGCSPSPFPPFLFPHPFHPSESARLSEAGFTWELASKPPSRIAEGRTRRQRPDELWPLSYLPPPLSDVEWDLRLFLGRVWGASRKQQCLPSVAFTSSFCQPQTLGSLGCVRGNEKKERCLRALTPAQVVP